MCEEILESKNGTSRNLLRFKNQAIWLSAGIVIGFLSCFVLNPSETAIKVSPEPIYSTKDTFIPVEGPFFFHNEEYSVCYDGRTKNPIWVYEHLSRENLSGSAKRSNRFYEDKRLPQHLRSTLIDYRRSGYDRGHLSAVANHKANQKAMDETFVMTNVSPQVGPGFNRGAWKALESRVRKIVARSLSVDVVSGPLYLPVDGIVSYQVIGAGEVAVPSHFFKVIMIEENNGERSTQAYILPNAESANNIPLNDYRSTVRRIERLAGIVLKL